MDRSFHQSFAALSGSFDGSLELWDLRGDEALQSCPVDARSVVASGGALLVDHDIVVV